MEITPDVEDRIVRYLLGELPAAESLEIENAYFTDDEYFESIQGLEAELLRNFVTDRMPPDLRRRFSQRYQSSPDLLKKLEFARASATASATLRVVQRGTDGPVVTALRFIAGLFQLPPFQFAMATVAMVALAAGVFFWRDNAHLRVEVARLERENRSRAEEKSSAQPTLATTPKEPLLLASFVLTAGVSRTQGEPQSVVVPKRIGLVQFSLPLPSGITYRGYRTILQKLPSNETSSQDLPPEAVVDSGRSLIAYIPSVSLEPGRYLLYVKGQNERGEFEDVQYYTFVVRN
jgi:hypothetical protein